MRKWTGIKHTIKHIAATQPMFRTLASVQIFCCDFKCCGGTHVTGIVGQEVHAASVYRLSRARVGRRLPGAGPAVGAVKTLWPSLRRRSPLIKWATLAGILRLAEPLFAMAITPLVCESDRLQKDGGSRDRTCNPQKSCWRSRCTNRATPPQKKKKEKEKENKEKKIKKKEKEEEKKKKEKKEEKKNESRKKEKKEKKKKKKMKKNEKENERKGEKKNENKKNNKKEKVKEEKKEKEEKKNKKKIKKNEKK
ncbi:uncharacterized protein LOC133537408 [Nerophis ophidion]|uniref:uncharacterized protein LOC133537408 n=1 Tax=Nerophis ophidion TaxID=159077 RepID=UPI002ADF3375|nr:uncharacterized protein LOC133537408 [Nerophis ophidion]